MSSAAPVRTPRICPSCGSIHRQHDIWWDCWPCIVCQKFICNQPVFSAPEVSCTCYVLHIEKEHPELYERQES